MSIALYFISDRSYEYWYVHVHYVVYTYTTIMYTTLHKE